MSWSSELLQCLVIIEENSQDGSIPSLCNCSLPLLDWARSMLELHPYFIHWLLFIPRLLKETKLFSPSTLKNPTEQKIHIHSNINKMLLVSQDNPTKTASTLRGNFYITGDRGYMDEDGYFWFVARSDDIILSSG